MIEVHKANIVHRDLHSRNILLKLNNLQFIKASVCDFGIAMNVKDREKMMNELRGIII